MSYVWRRQPANQADRIPICRPIAFTLCCTVSVYFALMVGKVGRVGQAIETKCLSLRHRGTNRTNDLPSTPVTIPPGAFTAVNCPPQLICPAISVTRNQTRSRVTPAPPWRWEDPLRSCGSRRAQIRNHYQSCPSPETRRSVAMSGTFGR